MNAYDCMGRSGCVMLVLGGDAYPLHETWLGETEAMRAKGRPSWPWMLIVSLAVGRLWDGADLAAQVAVQIGKNHQRVKARFRPVIARANRSTVRIFSADRPADRPDDVALGTIVGRGGYVLTVASRLEGKLRCRFEDGTVLAAEKVATVATHDVAVLRLSERKAPPAIWARDARPPVGSLLATPGRGPDPIAVGVVSVARSADGPPVLLHDTILRPRDCGGPVVDLSGRVVGINVRSGQRVTSTALPAAAAIALLTRLAADRPDLAALAPPPTDPPQPPLGDQVAGLRQLEAKVRGAAKRAIACTVGLRIGRTMGSGVIVSADGYLLTAAHVSRATGLAVDVFLADGRRVPGRTLGANRAGDTGLIKIDGSGPWPHARRADGPAAAVGRWCIATGHPSGFRRGRPPVVRLGRILKMTREAIVTDCVMKQGDSGGPLFDVNGNMLAVHSRIGHRLASNVHVPLRRFRDDWARLVRGDVWGGP